MTQNENELRGCRDFRRAHRLSWHMWIPDLWTRWPPWNSWALNVMLHVWTGGPSTADGGSINRLWQCLTIDDLWRRLTIYDPLSWCHLLINIGAEVSVLPASQNHRLPPQTMKFVEPLKYDIQHHINAADCLMFFKVLVVLRKDGDLGFRQFQIVTSFLSSFCALYCKLSYFPHLRQGMSSNACSSWRHYEIEKFIF